MVRLPLGCVMAAVTTVIACGQSFSASSGDGGVAEGGLGEGGGLADTGPGDAAESGAEGGRPDAADGSTGSVVYVAPTGADTSTGLDRAHPKRTIAAALLAASSLPAVPEVRVCKGTYTEASVVIGKDVKLLGAYDCATWMRTSGYGYPTPDGVATTTIASPGTTTQEAALIVSGAVTSATVIDGFVIAGATAGGHTDGVRVTDTASPVLSNDVISGGGGHAVAAASGSIGILVDAQAAPEVKDCLVSGGSGNGAIGSEGVLLDTTGAVSLHDSAISGGTGTTSAPTGGIAAIGVDVRAALRASKPLTALVVVGTDAVGTTGQTIGIRIQGGGVSAVVAGCAVEGGVGLDAATPSAGVWIDAQGGTVGLLYDRIYGGSRSTGAAHTFGVYVAQAGAVSVENTMVHAGTVASAAGAYAVGVDLASVAGPVVADDTIYTGGAAGTAIAINGGVSAAVLRDDLLLGSDSSLGAIGVATAPCGNSIASLDHTAFANLGQLFECSNGSTGSADVAIAQLEADPYAAASADVLVQPACPAGTGSSCAAVPACPSATGACLPAIFGTSWSTGDDGVSSLFRALSADAGAAADSWTLAPGSPCALTTGGTPVSGISSDISGHARSATTPTIGAAEYAGVTPCK